QLDGGSYVSSTYYNDLDGGIRLNCGNGSTLVRTATSVYLGGPIFNPLPGTTANNFVEVVNPARVPVRHDVPGVDHLHSLYAFNTGIVIWAQASSNNDILVSWDSASDTYITLLGAGTYVIGTNGVSVGPLGDVTFSGRRMSDNSRILGNIPA